MFYVILIGGKVANGYGQFSLKPSKEFATTFLKVFLYTGCVDRIGCVNM